MEQWQGRTAMVTGAGGSIGSVIAEDLVKAGMTVIGIENNLDKVKSMTHKSEHYMKIKYPGILVPYMCDISKDKEVIETFKYLTSVYGAIDVLINNAAICRDGLISTGDFKDFKIVLDTNLYGLVTVTKLAVESIIKYGTNGHIINLNSISGHYMPAFKEPRMNLYVASKQAMTSITEILRQEFRFLKANIKVTSISPGVVQSEVFADNKITAIDTDFLKKNPVLKCEDVSDVVLMALGTQPQVQIHEIIMHALHEIY